MELLLFALAGLAAVVFAYVRWQRRAARREALFALAQQHGLSYDRIDVLGVASRRFALFRRGDGSGAENLVHGTLDGGERVVVFDAWIVHRTRDGNGHVSEHHERFTCALGELPGTRLPHIRLRPESLGSRLRDTVGFEDIQFESDRFNRSWDVRSEDRRAAYAVVDAGVMQWLLMTDGRFEFEITGGEVLLVADQAEPREFLVLHRAVQQFRDRIPDVAAELYPRGGSSPRTS